MDYLENNSNDSSHNNKNKKKKSETDENIDSLVKKELEGTSENENRNPRVITLKIDKRLSITDLKNMIEPHLGVTPDNFKIYRMYSNMQEFEFTRPSDTLNSLCDDIKVSSLLNIHFIVVKTFLV